MFSLLAPDDGGQDRERGPGRQFEDTADDLLARLGLHGLIAVWAMTEPDAREQHAEVVVNLRDGADRAPRVATGGLLLNGDRRAQAVDAVDLRFGHLAQKLPGIARQALNVTSLPLSVERVERQRTLARAGNPCEADQMAAWKVEGDVPEVMLAGAPNHDVGRVHPWCVLCVFARRIREAVPVRFGGSPECLILYTCQSTVSIRSDRPGGGNLDWGPGLTWIFEHTHGTVQMGRFLVGRDAIHPL